MSDTNHASDNWVALMHEKIFNQEHFTLLKKIKAFILLWYGCLA